MVLNFQDRVYLGVFGLDKEPADYALLLMEEIFNSSSRKENRKRQLRIDNIHKMYSFLPSDKAKAPDKAAGNDVDDKFSDVYDAC